MLAAARFFSLDRHTVKSVDKARLRAELPEPDYSQLQDLAMGELALRKGHRHATVVLNALTRQVL